MTREIRTRKSLEDNLKNIKDTCSEKDWDCYGALPVGERSYNMTCSVVRNTPDDCLPDFISPCPNGGISLQWGNIKSKHMSITISLDGGYRGDSYRCSLIENITGKTTTLDSGRVFKMGTELLDDVENFVKSKRFRKMVDYIFGRTQHYIQN